MLHAALQLLLYALLAGLSPVAFAATIAVMPAGLLKVLGFGTAFLIAQLLTCVIFVVIGVAATTRIDHSGEAALVVLYVVLATVLVWAAVVLFVLLGDRSVALMKRAQEEVAARQPHVTSYGLPILAALLAVDANGTVVF